jgi:hypothetical protein
MSVKLNTFTQKVWDIVQVASIVVNAACTCSSLGIAILSPEITWQKSEGEGKFGKKCSSP